MIRMTPEQATSLSRAAGRYRSARRAGEHEVVLRVADVQRLLQVARHQSKPLARAVGPDAVAEWAGFLTGLEHEELWVAGVDAKCSMVGADRICVGGMSGVSVTPREVLRAALAIPHAAAFILVHNHPSGDPRPSAEDRLFTRNVQAAASTVGLELLDHVVVSRNGWRSIIGTE